MGGIGTIREHIMATAARINRPSASRIRESRARHNRRA
jgi:hypothetical protein